MSAGLNKEDLKERTQAIFTLARKEFMDNVRNKWIIILSLIFVGLILLVSAYGGTQTSQQQEGFQGYRFTISIGSSLVVLLISIVAIILGYKAIIGEIQTKSIALILASDLGRADVVVGKFLGLASVLSICIFGGLGLGGIIIGVFSGFEDFNLYLGFIGFSFMFSLAYLAISLMMSTFVKKKSHALAGGIFIWIFFNIIWDLVRFGILVASGWEMPADPGQTMTMPDWYYSMGALNPNSLYSMGLNRVLENADLPELLDTPLITICLLAWFVLPLVLSVLWLDRKDL